jgi:hypothetical protein
MPAIEDVDIDVEDWIDGVTYTQVRVTLYRNPALYAEYEPLAALIEVAESDLAELEGVARPDSDAPSDEASIGDAPSTAAQEAAAARERLDGLYAKAEALHERFESDREVWSLRALAQQEVADIIAAHPRPPEPSRPKSGSTAAQRAAYARRVEKWAVDARPIQHRINAEMLSAATVQVDVNGAIKPAPTPEGVERVRIRPHGERHIAQLLAALEQITAQEVTIPAPHRAGA